MGRRLLLEIKSRLGFLCEVGLGYLTLSWQASTLSGGESQRVRLTTSLGSPLVGSLYILDEPSIGLHSRDTDRLIRVLRQLQQQGNTVVVVEHDEEIMRAADWLIDIDPTPAPMVVRSSTKRPVPQAVKDRSTQESQQLISQFPRSYTLKYLTHEEQIPIPASRRQWNKSIILRGCRMNNLKNIDVKSAAQRTDSRHRCLRFG